MKSILILILILKVQVSIAQIVSDTARQITIPKNFKLNVEKQRQQKITNYVDSINNYNGKTVPEFLLTTCFDWQPYLWQDLHTPTSLRWMILCKVSNKNALLKLLNLNDPRLRLVCTRQSDKIYPYLSVPMIELSFYELIKKRYEQL